ncbi:hypothetical protein ACFLT7_02930 [candidate division KSB1 bacterium]
MNETLTTIRDIIFIIGIPTIIYIGIKMYHQQIQTMRTQIDFLKETQYDRALKLIKSQRELHDEEVRKLEKGKEKILKSGEEKQNEINKLNEKLKLMEIDAKKLKVQEGVIATQYLDDFMDFTYISGEYKRKWVEALKTTKMQRMLEREVEGEHKNGDEMQGEV